MDEGCAQRGEGLPRFHHRGEELFANLEGGCWTVFEGKVPSRDPQYLDGTLEVRERNPHRPKRGSLVRDFG